MKSYLGLVRKYVQVHRKKNRLTLTCVILAVFLVGTVLSMMDMLRRTEISSEIRRGGNWHVMIENASQGEADVISLRRDVAVSGFYTSVGKEEGYRLKGNPRKLYISGIEEEVAAKVFNAEVIQGSYPSGADEALLMEDTAKDMGVGVGGRVTLVSPEGEERELTVTGLTEDTVMMLSRDAAGLLLTPQGMEENIPEDESAQCYVVQFGDHAHMRGAIREIEEGLSLSAERVTVNNVLLALYGQSDDSYMINLYLTGAVLTVLVLTAGVLMIASSFHTGVVERVKFFGMLRCLGASKKQVKRYVMCEGLYLCRTAVPVGLVLSLLTVWALSGFLKYVNPGYFSDIPLFGVSVPGLAMGAAAGVAAVFFSSLSPCRRAARVSPLSAVSGSRSYARPRAGRTAGWLCMRRVETGLGVRHALSGKKNLLLMTGSFAISIILFLSFSMMVDFMRHGLKALQPWSPDLSVVAKDNALSVPSSVFRSLREDPAVRRVFGRMFAYDVPAETADGEKKANLISYEELQFSWAEAELARGSLEETMRGEGVLAAYSPMLTLEPGDELSLLVNGEMRTVKVSGILSRIPLDRGEADVNLICSEEMFREWCGTEGYTVLDVQLDKGAVQEDVDRISALAGENSFLDRRKGNAESRAVQLTFSLFVYGFLATVALITVFQIVNVMRMSVAGRMEQYGAMRAVGMETGQLARMVLAEASVYSLFGCAAGCLLGLPIHRALYGYAVTYRWGTAWRIPVGALAFICLLVAAVTALSVIPPIRRIKEMNVVEVVGVGE